MAAVFGAGCSSAGRQVSAGAGSAAVTSAPDCPAPDFPPVGVVTADGPATPDTMPEMPASPDFALMSVIETYGRAHGDTYGGTWIDRSQPGSPITVGFTADVDARRAELLASRAGPDDYQMITPTLPPLRGTVGEAGWPVVVVLVPYSSADLEQVQSAVSAFSEGEGHDLGINSVGSGTSGGPVEVGLGEVTDQAREALGERFGAAVCVTQQNAFSPVGSAVP